MDLFKLAIRLALGGLIVGALQSCALIKSAVHFTPNTDDYKLFACDTIRANPDGKPIFKDGRAGFQLPPLEQWVAPHVRKQYKTAEELFEATHSCSFIVVRGDSILYENYFNKYTPDQKRVVFSVTKAITAILVGMAEQEGQIKLNQKTSDFIPEFAEDNRRRIEIHHLMNMTEGLNWIDYKHVGWLGLMYYTSNQRRFMLNRSALRHRPGTHFAYKSITTQILGFCLEGATKKRMTELLQEKLWTPLHFEQDGWFTLDSKKNKGQRAFGGLAMSPRDMLRIGKLLKDNGKWEGKQLLPPSFTEALTHRRVAFGEKWWGYTYCFWQNGYLDNDFDKMSSYQAAGYHGQFIFVCPEHDIIIIRTGSDNGDITWDDIFGRLAATLGGKGNDLTDPANYDFSSQFEGVYESDRGEKLVVVNRGLNKENRPYWRVYKDVGRTIHTKLMHKELVRVDGRSIVLRKFGRQSRLMFDIKDRKIVGLNYDNLVSIDTRYFEKTGELPPKFKRKSRQ